MFIYSDCTDPGWLRTNVLHVCRRTTDSEVSPIENTDRNKNPNIEKPKTASFMYKYWCQTAAIVATFKVNHIFLDDNTGLSSHSKEYCATGENQGFTCSESMFKK